MYKIVSFLLFLSYSVYSQEDSLVLFKERKDQVENYSFGEGQLFYSPSIGFSKGTKNNFGFEVEYAGSNLIGLVAGVGTSSFDNETISLLNSHGIYKTRFTSLFFGLRGHSGYISHSKSFDIMPGLYWVKLFDPDEILESSSQLVTGIDLRYFFNKHFAINLSASLAFVKNADPGFGIGLVFR